MSNNIYVNFFGPYIGFYSILKNGVSQETNSAELLYSKLNGIFKNNFSWKISYLFFLKNIEDRVGSHSTAKAESFVCTGKFAALLTVIKY